MGRGGGKERGEMGREEGRGGEGELKGWREGGYM